MTPAHPIAVPLRVQPKPAERPEELVEFDARAELLAGLWCVPLLLILFLALAVMMPGGPANG